MENIKNYLPNKLTFLIIIVSLVFCFQLFSLFSNSKESVKVDYIKKEIKDLKKEVNEIYKSEEALGKKIDTFKSEIKNIHKAINVNNVKIDNLKKYEKTQTDKFNSYDARMLEQYFTNRYIKKNTTTTKRGE